VQIWVPDTRKAGFAAECRRQSRLLGKSNSERSEMKWLTEVADTADWK
jgi:hypothetical protein